MLFSRRLARLASPLLAASVLVGALPALPAAGAGPVRVVGREVATSVAGSRELALPLTASHVAVHWAGDPEASIRLAFSSDGQSYGPPEAVEHDEAGGHDETETYGAVTWTSGARFVRITSDRPIARLSVVAINSTGASAGSGTIVQAAVQQPAVISRAGWGADESLRFDSSGNELWPPDFHPIQKLIVHHTAGKNGDPNPAATVRAIYYYHAVTRGWGDIGYNFLIDEAGRVYEGRYSRPYASGEIPTGEDTSKNGVVGAHVAGYNSGTVGIALLGTLTDQDAAPGARAALEQLLAWKAERHAIDPLGSGTYINPVTGTKRDMANISAHRDLAATECPGGTFYSTFPALRQAVAARIAGSTTKTVPGAPVLTASTPTSGKGVLLSWTVPPDGGSPITEYRVLRLKSGSFVRIATLGASKTSYRDTSTKRGRTYTYVVRAVNGIGVGPRSNEASAKAR
ncbi:MAG: N-acetylmuramoyl-L-alanine amidase [Chloroflexota bacterium]|nr:N-acetylmuramoyl-L-alanine amidase [Chloroflexota bacterium]